MRRDPMETPRVGAGLVDPETSTVRIHTVDVAQFDADRVAVASDLHPGDIVLTAGAQVLRPGRKVRLLEPRP